MIHEETNADHGQDVKGRIDRVIDRFRSNAGPEFYNYKLKYIDDIDLDPVALLAIAMACVFIPLKLITDGNVFYGILLMVWMPLFLILKSYARGKILKEKVWENDFVSDEDILYLCENEKLKPILIEELKAGTRHTYSRLESKKKYYVESVTKNEGKKRCEQLLTKINNMPDSAKNQ
ncbi:TPA: hypothetical protein OR518_003655 [Escherichia coli]|nr:hypothetical protein [Salmonella enterica]HCS7470076.1 hypothetical protein [Escherichia coli]